MLDDFIENDKDWLLDKLLSLTDNKEFVSVVEWAETNRYLPPQVTPLPGFYDYNVAPYLREIASCMDSDSPIREIDFMKGAQIGATVGVLENAIGYAVDHIKSAPIMLLTADSELAKLRIDSYIMPMFQHSGLINLIQATDDMNGRKSGRTDKKIEWQGGGYLVPFVAKNADKLRSISIQILFFFRFKSGT